MGETLNRRIRRLYRHAARRTDAFWWRHLKDCEREKAALGATITEIQRLISLQKPRRRRRRTS